VWLPMKAFEVLLGHAWPIVEHLHFFVSLYLVVSFVNGVIIVTLSILL
jgi:hypothetical protein